MAYEYYNPNPMQRNVGDCSVRAVAKALGVDWETATEEGTLWADIPETGIRATTM